MANFHFYTGNHLPNGRDTLNDMIDWFKAGLLDGGHQVSISDSFLERNALNVIWDFFSQDFIDNIIDSKISFGIVATEIPDGVGFNWRQEPDWMSRYQRFCKLAPHASFIWTMVESTVQFYQKFAPTSYIPLGFSDRLVPKLVDGEPTIDFSFFGLKTPYRESIVEQLNKHFKVIWPAFMPKDQVQDLVLSTRVGLSFKQSGLWPIPSPTRLGRYMMSRRAVAVEYVPVATRQGEIAGICPDDRPFVDYATERLGTWRAHSTRVFETYRALMPMKDIMSKAIEDCGSPKTSRSFWKRRKHFARESEVELVERLGSFNIVSYREEYLALPLSWGPVDLKDLGLKGIPCRSESLKSLKYMLQKNTRL